MYIRDTIIRNSSPNHKWSTSLLSSWKITWLMSKAMPTVCRPIWPIEVNFFFIEKHDLHTLFMKQVQFSSIRIEPFMFLCSRWSALQLLAGHVIATWENFCPHLGEILKSSSRTSFRAAYLPVEAEKTTELSFCDFCHPSLLFPTPSNVSACKLILNSSSRLFNVLFTAFFWTKLMAKS